MMIKFLKDLPERLFNGWPLNKYNRSTFYTPGAKGIDCVENMIMMEDTDSDSISRLYRLSNFSTRPT